MYELFFEMEISLCERFPALSPFDIRKQRAGEVFLLVRRLNNYTEYTNDKNDTRNGTVIRRRAGDDWF